MTLVSTLAEELAGEFRLQPLLEKILVNAVRLLDCRSGSICTIDEARNVYRKEVDLDVHCQAGQIFSLDEGVTGAVRRRSDFVVFDRYGDVPSGHITPDDDRFDCPVVGVPLTHNDVLIGAFIVFGLVGGRPFTAADAAKLALFATHASIAIVNSRAHQVALDRALSEALHGTAPLTPAPPAGPPLTSPPLTGQPPAGPPLTGPPPAGPPLTAAATGPSGTAPRTLPPDAHLTTREQQVRALVVQGLPDKHIAAALGISARTVEKHVGTILRKTGARNRTMLASLQGWGAAGYGGNPA